jgi:hypothetical protein
LRVTTTRSCSRSPLSNEIGQVVTHVA